jgi:hypothetical protein
MSGGKSGTNRTAKLSGDVYRRRQAIGKEVGVTRRTLSTWKLEPEFAEAVACIRAKTQILGSFVYHRRGITDALKKPLFTLLSSSQINAFLLPVGRKG